MIHDKEIHVFNLWKFTSILKELKYEVYVASILHRIHHTWEGWGRVRECWPMHDGLWGGYVTIFWKLLNRKALAKRFSFILHMNTWVNTYWKIHMSLRVHFKSVRSSSWLVCTWPCPKPKPCMVKSYLSSNHSNSNFLLISDVQGSSKLDETRSQKWHQWKSVWHFHWEWAQLWPMEMVLRKKVN